MAKLEFCSSIQHELTDVAKIKSFLHSEGIELGMFPLNETAKKYKLLDTLTEEQRVELIQSYPELIESYSKLSDFRYDVVCLYPEFEHLDFILNKFGDVHYHFENEYWYFIDGCFNFIFLGSRGLKYNVTVEAGEYLQVPEGKWQYFVGTRDSRMKAMRFFNTTNKEIPYTVDCVSNKLILENG